jgi:hypothetical protein
MDLYPWSFDSIHSHCHNDMIIFLKEFLIIWANGHLRGVFKKNRFERKLAKRYIREEDNKSNKQVMDKLLIQMSQLVLY